MIGDHIRALVGGEWRHAVDCGDGTVLHLVSDVAATPATRVRRSYRPEFVAGAEQVEVVVHRERVFPARQVVARAYSRAADPALARMFETSAAFASWCKAGHVEARDENVTQPVPALVAPAPLDRLGVSGPKPLGASEPKRVVKKPAAKAAPKPVARRPAKAVAGKQERKSPAKRAATRRPARPAKAAKVKVKAKATGPKRPAKRAAKAQPRTAARRSGSKARASRR